MGDVCVQAIGTAVPRYRAPQAQVQGFMTQVARAQGGSTRDVEGVLGRVYRRSGIEWRSSVLSDYTGGPEGFTFYPNNWRLQPFPGTAARMQVYQREAPGLALQAVQACLRGAPQIARRRSSITHLIVASCTGMFAPGLDVLLVQELGLRPEVQRQMIGFMGCYAAFNAVRAARAVCQAEADAVVLVVCVELCSLHFQRELTMDNIVANCLFSDGAAALLLTGAGHDSAGGRLMILDSYTRLADPGTAGQMTWDVTDTGFQMRLGAEVPESLRQAVGPFVDELLRRSGLSRRDPALWAVHPGGRRILEVVQAELGLPGGAMDASYAVLAQHGNMSSPTVLFVLERCLEGQPAGGLGVALGFGPGLTLESLLFRALPGQARAEMRNDTNASTGGVDAGV